MMRTILFDDSGEMWDAKSPNLARSLQASLSGDELAKYVVRNLGFIAVTESAGSLRLRLRPAVVSQTALSALLYWLHDQPTIDRLLISFLDGDWTHELVRSCGQAVRTLLARVKFHAADREGDFLKKPRPLHHLPRTSPLRPILEAWADSEGRYDRERLHPIIQRAVNGRFVLVESSPASPTLRIKDVGGMGNVANYWLSRSIGLRVEDQPDYAYGKWVATPYRQVLNTGEPSLDDVDAVITWPQQPRIGYRYRRLVLPFNGNDNSTLLLGVTLVDPSIDLRIKPN
jgi:hypothetical protein